MLDEIRFDQANGFKDLAQITAEQLVTKWPESPEAKEASRLMSPAGATASTNTEAGNAEPTKSTEDEQKRKLADRWQYEGFQDNMTSETVHVAHILSDNSVEFDPPYDGTQFASLTLWAYGDGNNDAEFKIDKGQIECGLGRRFPVQVRFASEKADFWWASQAPDHDSPRI